jgi:hypothetical protein|tara:strand:- start:3834 stop:4151 length:318 start_codon:yes stop_codon:yes gene_type:complete
MSRINKLINAFGNLDQIANGIKNKLFQKEEIEEIAWKRWQICTQCNYFDTVGNECAVPGTAPCCSDCGCILNLKVRSLSSRCPQGKWEAFMNEDMEDDLKNSLEG